MYILKVLNALSAFLFVAGLVFGWCPCLEANVFDHSTSDGSNGG